MCSPFYAVYFIRIVDRVRCFSAPSRPDKWQPHQ
jgi:hypothetical protein